ncbi:hypothetical protein EDD91_0139 [Streptomyces sp. KS 21]|nr:hypothetical protein EDD91_0139 [Streptomyces sp. KS 21]
MFGCVTVGAMGLRSYSKSAAPAASEAAECVDEAARQSNPSPGAHRAAVADSPDRWLFRKGINEVFQRLPLQREDGCGD